MKAKTILIVTLITLLFNFSSIKFADTTSDWSYLNNVVDQAYQFTKHYEYGKAKRLMEHFSRQYTLTTSTTDESFQKQYQILTTSYNQALKAISDEEVSHDDRVQQMLKFRLVVDAMNSKYQPLWVELEPKIMSAFEEMRNALEDDQMNDFPHKFNQFLVQYETIYPSLVIALSEEQLEALNAHISFFEGYETADYREQSLQIEKMERDLMSVFSDVHMDESDPTFIWVLLSMASIIFIALTYVGWRKYIGDRIF